MSRAKISMVLVKGYECMTFDMKQASARKALQLRNMITSQLKGLGIHEDSISVKEEALVIKRTPASVSWYMDGQHLYFSYSSLSYMENLSFVAQVIEAEVNDILSGKKTREECIADFSEEHDIEKKRKEAREILGVSASTIDVDLINKKYKDLSKTHHPDMGGDLEMFQKINKAHKTLKKELVV